jgi:hypothetical protein
VSFAHGVEILVTDHAMWRAAERFPGFDTAEIETEVRAALAAGRVETERTKLGLTEGSLPWDLYVYTADERRVYALAVDQYDARRMVVKTAMDPLDGCEARRTRIVVTPLESRQPRSHRQKGVVR